VCCLREDFKTMPIGDLTKVGEKGQILSGGQRSRISIARALYRKTTDIILIDGSLSSLDARVTRHIIDNLLGSELTVEKMIITVVYDLDQAKEMDYILNVTDNGKVEVMTKEDFQ